MTMFAIMFLMFIAIIFMVEAGDKINQKNFKIYLDSYGPFFVY